MTAPFVRLDDVIDHIKSQAPDGGSLDHLTQAVLVSDYLGELADSVIGHFVDQARHSGASWTEIGRSLGVTKQAAQQRFVPAGPGDDVTSGKMFARFTLRDRNAVRVAQDEARRTGRDTVGTEHLLFGLVSDPGGFAAKAIVAHGTPIEEALEAIRAATGPASDQPSGPIPPRRYPRALRELAAAEAVRLGHDYIGTEHILLGILASAEGAGSELLTGFNLTRDSAEEWITNELRGFTSSP